MALNIESWGAGGRTDFVPWACQRASGTCNILSVNNRSPHCDWGHPIRLGMLSGRPSSMTEGTAVSAAISAWFPKFVVFSSRVFTCTAQWPSDLGRMEGHARLQRTNLQILQEKDRAPTGHQQGTNRAPDRAPDRAPTALPMAYRTKGHQIRREMSPKVFF